MSIVVVTGSAGLIGSEAVKYFADKGLDIIGIDNNLRKKFFGEEASTEWNRKKLVDEYSNYTHYDFDIRNNDKISSLFKKFGSDIELIIHTAAQPSHDWAARDPQVDFTVNANGTLNLLESARNFCPDSVFIFTSTNKVYGDRPNNLPLLEKDTRWEIDPSHKYKEGISEDMSIDNSTHSLFGASKVAADILVQEYGRYFGMKTASFRGGCLTGPNHSGAQLHGFLAYLMKCAATGNKYTIFGYKGKQVRDNIHSSDLISAFDHFFTNPRSAEVYNIGGGRYSNCSMIEAIDLCEEITGSKMNYEYSKENRVGDHIWYISDLAKFKSHFPSFNLKYNVKGILKEIYDYNQHRWQ